VTFSAHPDARPPRVRDHLLVLVLYVVTAEIAFNAAVVHGSACPVWPPTAVSIVAVLRFGPRILPAIAAAIVLTSGTRPVPALVVALTVVANVLEPLVVVAVLQRLRGASALVTVRDVCVFLFAVCVGAVVSATGGAGGLLASGLIDLSAVPHTAALWALGNVGGAACVAPLVLSPRGRGHASRSEIVILLVLAATVGGVVLGDPDGQIYAIFPLLIWAGLRLGPRGAAAVTMILAGLAVTFAARGEGPFAGVSSSPTDTLLAAQGFIVITALTTLLLAAITEDRRRTQIELLETDEERRVMTAEQAALRRVATIVAEQASPGLVLARVSQEVAALAGVAPQIVATHLDHGERLDSAVRRRLEPFTELIAIATANAESRERLTAQATTDPLTGLLNHRAFHERLREEVARAHRHGHRLSVAVFDLDHFKRVNDTLGHAVGDEVLALAAQRLRRAARRDEAVGRVGGDELAVIMTEVGDIDAFVAADRLRQAISTAPYPQAGLLSASAGTCDLEQAPDAGSLLRLADGALYWAKAHGRDVCFRYTPDVVAELSATERAERLTRSQALSGIRALARAIDAKDRSTTQHSERVAELAARLARVRGWRSGDVSRLRAAGLVHDVGKIGIPDAVLFKPGRLSEAERLDVQRHAELGAQIAAEVLDDEQVSWILAHHEHVDGGGYPRAISGDAIPEGGRLLALADAWDAMTKARPYSSPMTPEAAYRECRRQTGKQFCPDAVRALEELWESGGLDVDLSASRAVEELVR